jgi:hypothetical protein
MALQYKVGLMEELHERLAAAEEDVAVRQEALLECQDMVTELQAFCEARQQDIAVLQLKAQVGPMPLISLLPPASIPCSTATSLSNSCSTAVLHKKPSSGAQAAAGRSELARQPVPSQCICSAR